MRGPAPKRLQRETVAKLHALLGQKLDPLAKLSLEEWTKRQEG